MALLLAGWCLATDRVVVSLDSGVERALDPGIRSQRDGLFGLKVLEHHIRLAQQKLVLEQAADSVDVDLIEVVLVEWTLESAQALEDLQNLALRVPDLDVRVLA